MKTLTYFTLLICLPLLGSVLNAQDIQKTRTGTDPPTREINAVPVTDDPSGSASVNLNKDLGVESGIFLNKEWMPGKIVLKDKSVLTGRLLRYNIYAHQVQFVYQEDTMAFANPDEIAHLEFDNRKYINTDFIYKDELRRDYLEVLVEGEHNLLLYRNIVYRFSDPNKADEQITEEHYFMEELFYVQDEKGNIKRMPETKKAVLQCLSDKDDQLKGFIKENKIKLYRESDLIRLVEYCNSRKNK